MAHCGLSRPEWTSGQVCSTLFKLCHQWRRKYAGSPRSSYCTASDCHEAVFSGPVGEGSRHAGPMIWAPEPYKHGGRAPASQSCPHPSTRHRGLRAHTSGMHNNSKTWTARAKRKESSPFVLRTPTVSWKGKARSHWNKKMVHPIPTNSLFFNITPSIWFLHYPTHATGQSGLNPESGDGSRDVTVPRKDTHF